eukprot:gene29339-18359_t
MGLGAALNRTMWRQKGRPTGLAGYGPNINIARDPRFGRNSELPGEDPFLSGSYAVESQRAVEFVHGAQEADAAGHPRMVTYLKHFTAYSRETDRGHDDYAISAYDFADTYLPQYEMGMVAGGASGVMCSYNAENGAPSCANGWLLNDVLRGRWNRSDAVVTSDGGAVRNLEGAPLFRAGLFDPLDSVEWASIGAEEINSTAHQRVNYEAALQSMVAVVGPQAEARGGLLSDYASEEPCADGTDQQPPPTAWTRSGGSRVSASLEGEGRDRTSIALPGVQEPFAQQVKGPTVLVLTNGGALAIDSLVSGPGQRTAFNPCTIGASALAALLFGKESRNTGAADGDEVVLAFHRPGSRLRPRIPDE